MAKESRDPYALLRVGPTATTAQIRRAYRRMIVVSHRSRVIRLVEHLEELRIAYETLKDPSLRHRHDSSRNEQHTQPRPVELPLLADVPDDANAHRREGAARVAMARELDALSRKRSSRSLAATSESMRVLAREHDEREAEGARELKRRARSNQAIAGAVCLVVLAAAVLVTQLMTGSR